MASDIRFLLLWLATIAVLVGSLLLLAWGTFGGGA